MASHRWTYEVVNCLTWQIAHVDPSVIGFYANTKALSALLECYYCTIRACTYWRHGKKQSCLMLRRWNLNFYVMMLSFIPICRIIFRHAVLYRQWLQVLTVTLHDILYASGPTLIWCDRSDLQPSKITSGPTRTILLKAGYCPKNVLLVIELVIISCGYLNIRVHYFTVTWVTNHAGKKMAIIEGYTFYCHRTSKNKYYWQCTTTRKCNARFTMTVHGEMLHLKAVHTHVPPNFFIHNGVYIRI